MKTNNISNVSFKSVYIVESSTPEPQSEQEQIMRLLQRKKSSTEKLYDLLSVGGENKKVALINNGGLFMPELGCPTLVSIDDPQLLLVDDEIDQPVARFNEFNEKALAESTAVNKMTLDELKAKLSTEEIEAELRQMREINPSGCHTDEAFSFGLKVQQKVISQATEQYQKLYAEFLKQAKKLPETIVEQTKKAMQKTGLDLLAALRK